VNVCVGSQLSNHGGGVSSDDRGRGHVARPNAAGSDDAQHNGMTFGPVARLSGLARTPGPCVPSPEGEAERFGGAGVEGVLVAWEGALVVGGADESMKRRDDEVVPGKTGRRRGGASGGAGALTEAETRVPTSLLQREKDRKRGSSSILDSPSSIHLVLSRG
jgi:hypothetical protein